MLDFVEEHNIRCRNRFSCYHCNNFLTK